jgi:hypothetical protein
MGSKERKEGKPIRKRKQRLRKRTRDTKYLEPAKISRERQRRS